jgi:hypothetical protein
MVSSVVSVARVENVTKLMGTNCTVVFAKQAAKINPVIYMITEIFDLAGSLFDYLSARERRKQAEAILEREIEALSVLVAEKEAVLEIRKKLIALMEDKRKYLHKELRLKLEGVIKAYEYLLNDVKRRNRAIKTLSKLLESIRMQMEEILKRDGRNGHYARLEDKYYRIVSEFAGILVSNNSREKIKEEV